MNIYPYQSFSYFSKFCKWGRLY